MPADICNNFPKDSCSKSASFYSELNAENLLQVSAYWRALTSACRIQIASDETFDIKVFNQKLERALAARDFLACIEAEREFNRHHKKPLFFGRICIHEREHIAREIKARLGAKGFNNPMIKVLRGESNLQEAILSTPVMHGRGKRKTPLKNILRYKYAESDDSYEELEAQALADGIEIHRLLEKGVTSWLQIADMPIDSVIGDRKIVLSFLDKGILPTTNKPIVVIPPVAGFKLQNNILWNREQLQSLVYLKVTLEYLLPILLQQKKGGLAQRTYQKTRDRVRKLKDEQQKFEQLMESEDEGEYSETPRVTKQITKEYLENEPQRADVADKIERILRPAKQHLSPEGFKAIQLYRAGYTQEEAAKLAGITDKTFRNNLAKLKKVVLRPS